MSFIHMANFSWTDQVAPEEVDCITAALTALAGALVGVESYRCGADVSRTPDSYDYGVVGVFRSREDFLAYRDHPEHERISREMIVPRLASRAVVQLQD